MNAALFLLLFRGGPNSTVENDYTIDRDTLFTSPTRTPLFTSQQRQPLFTSPARKPLFTNGHE